MLRFRRYKNIRRLSSNNNRPIHRCSVNQQNHPVGKKPQKIKQLRRSPVIWLRI